jgi:thiosulfate dehydrogenase (quinone) large subunit
MPWAMRILRAFLGVTFVYAGTQKFLDVNFLRAGSQDYIGKQLDRFAQGTPVAPLMHVLAKMPWPVGVGIALTEIAIGLATLLGIGMMLAALAGFAINLVLWLSATWHVHPYFLGSDSIYAVAWLALFAGLVESQQVRNPSRASSSVRRASVVGRREVLRGGAIAGLALGVGVMARAFAGTGTGAPPRDGLAAGGTRRGGETALGGGAGPSGTSAPAAGRTIATLDQLPIGKAVGFTDPGIGQAVLVRLVNGNVVAYSRTCTHAGCPVSYDTSQHVLFCPCHGAEFDPAHGAAVIAGPAPAPLQKIDVVVQGNDVILPSV